MMPISQFIDRWFSNEKSRRTSKDNTVNSAEASTPSGGAILFSKHDLEPAFIVTPYELFREENAEAIRQAMNENRANQDLSTQDNLRLYSHELAERYRALPDAAKEDLVARAKALNEQAELKIFGPASDDEIAAYVFL